MENAQYLALLKRLQLSYRLKFDGTILWVVPRARRAVKFSLTTTADEVRDAGGSTRAALLLKLAGTVGVAPTGEPQPEIQAAKVDHTQDVLARVGLDAAYVGPEHYREYEFALLLPGRAVAVRYAVIGVDEVYLLCVLTPDVPLGDCQALCLQHFLSGPDVPCNLKNPKVLRHLKQWQAYSTEAKLVRRLNPGLPLELGVPAVNRVLVVA